MSDEVKVGSQGGTPFYISKTMIASAVTAAAPHIPYVKDIVAAEPEFVLSLVGVIFAVLRIVTTNKLEWKKSL